jgi:hypothetical protein
MTNLIIVGSARSGTSMVAGTIAQAGFFVGDDLWPPKEGNPLGYFEDREINLINEEILKLSLPQRISIDISEFNFLRKRLKRNSIPLFFKNRPEHFQRWLSRAPLDSIFQSTSDIHSRIQSIIKSEPFCFKDPRFSYTLPIWKPFLHNTRYICVFREPEVTVESILSECSRENYLRSLKINCHDAFMVWSLMYNHILKIHSQEGQWCFIHYNQMIQGGAIDRLEGFIDSKIDGSFINPILNRSKSSLEAPEECRQIYQSLCQLANYESA